MRVLKGGKERKDIVSRRGTEDKLKNSLKRKRRDKDETERKGVLGTHGKKGIGY